MEEVAYNEETGVSTMRVSFTAGPMEAPPDMRLSSAKLEVYDPDLTKVAEASLSNVLVNQLASFPDVDMTFDKSGTYVFLVSAWDKPYVDLFVDKAHRYRPLLQHNVKVTSKKLAVMLDPGHGAVMHEGTKKHRGGNSTDPDGVFPVMYESDNVLTIASSIRTQLQGKRYIASVAMTRNDEWDIGPQDKIDCPVGTYQPAAYERQKRTKRFMDRNQGHWVVFVSVHTNAPGSGAQNYYQRHGTQEVNPDHSTWLGSYILAWLSCNDPTLTELVFLNARIQSNMVLNLIGDLGIPATLIEVAHHTNWRDFGRGDHYLEAKRLRNDAGSGNADFRDRVATCFESGLWSYWAIQLNSHKERSWYDCLSSFSGWPE